MTRKRERVIQSVVDGRLNFGKHKEKPLKHVPTDYLVWLLEGFCRLDTKGYNSVRSMLESRNVFLKDCSPKAKTVEDIVEVEIEPIGEDALREINELRKEMGLPPKRPK